MKTTGLVSLGLLALLTGCGDAETETGTWVAPSPALSTVEPAVLPLPSSPAVSKSVKPSRPPSRTPSAPKTSAKPLLSDKKLCAAVVSAKEDVAEVLLPNLDDDGNVAPEIAGPVIKKFASAVSSAAAKGGDTKVASAMRDLAAAGKKAAVAKDPMAASESGAMDAANDRVESACAAVGVEI